MLGIINVSGIFGMQLVELKFGEKQEETDA